MVNPVFHPGPFLPVNLAGYFLSWIQLAEIFPDQPLHPHFFPGRAGARMPLLTVK